MGWTIDRLAGAAAFRDEAFEYLGRREAEHNIFFGVTLDTIRDPGRYPNDNYFAVARDEADGTVGGAAFRTPPHPPVLSLVEEPAVARRFAEDLFADYGPDIGGLNAPNETGPIFRARFDAICADGGSWELGMAQRIYSLDTVVPVTGVEGRLSPAARGDRDVLIGWLIDFQLEASSRSTVDAAMRATRLVESALEHDEAFVWRVDDEPVSMAYARGPTPHGIRVSLVYTPGGKRRRGYASACVAALSQRMLDEGRTFCFLFTDLSNPTSNHIYQEIGYRPVCDFSQYRRIRPGR